jgi:signal transduction histidine kinase
MLYLYYKPNYNILIGEILIKFYLVYTAAMINELTLYIFSVCYEKEDNKYYTKIKGYSFMFCIIVSICTCFLPVHINDLYGYGASCNFVSLYSVINVFYWSISIHKNNKKFRKNVIYPLYVFILLAVIAGVIQALFPTLAIVTIIEFIITYLIYLTMENTDYKMIKELEIAKNKVNEANSVKSDFLKNMSHEIRTPLNGIIGLAEDIRINEKSIPKELNDDAAELIYYSNLLLDTISSIIDINKLDSKHTEIIENNYDIRTIITQIKKSIVYKVSNTTKLNISISDNIPILYGDEGHIRQIITKLLENSLQTTTNGDIDLIIDIEDILDKPRLKIVVKDEGIGIHNEILPYVYEYNTEKIKGNKYYNAKLSLNLSVTKKIVEMLKGNINIVSIYGKGTTVVVEIPQQPGRRAK